MKKEIAQKWVAALRSGNYEQTNHCLFDGKGYCCLGVLEKEMGAAFVTPDVGWSFSHGIFIHEADDGDPAYYESESLTASTCRRAEVQYPDGQPWDNEVRIVINGRTFSSLAQANDDGIGFSEIADWIEANYQQL